MSSPFRNAQRKHSIPNNDQCEGLDYYIDEDDLEGSTKADTGELARYKSHMMESDSPGTARPKGKNLESAKGGVDYNSENHLDDIKEECSRTEEGQRIGTMRGNFDIEVIYAKIQGRLERRAKRSFLEELSNCGLKKKFRERCPRTSVRGSPSSSPVICRVLALIEANS
ncbi:DIRP domain-containing protein [Forsythia ovata]|uniref:DIRP domain-containing protein n=1 Tax=Forsythia ovata TaxID=205694 RepID=A0ABD1WCF3_9LAMI